MKITPIEIRQHTFQKVLRGYDAEEVAAFLNSLSNEWERVLNEGKMLKMQLELAEKELNKLREVELTMFRMLKTAEDTTAQMTDQAKTAAEQYIGEAKAKAEEIIGESRKKANMLIVDAENQSKYIREEILNEFRNHERDFKAMEKYRDNLMVQLKTLANNTNDSLERFEKKFNTSTLKEKFGDLREQVTSSIKTSEEAKKALIPPTEQHEEAAEDEPEVKPEVVEEVESKVPEETAAAVVLTNEIIANAHQEEEKEEEKDKGSFFDQL